MQPTLVNKVKEVTKSDGEICFKFDEEAEKVLDQTAPGFKKIARYLMTTDVRKHSRYCPCCKKYEEGGELTPYGMSQFLEYIRKLNNKLSGSKRPKKIRKLHK